MLRESIVDLWHELGRHRARTLVTILGLAWGVYAIVLLLAFGFGLKRLFQERADNFGRGIGIIWPSQTSKSYQGTGPGRFINLRSSDIANLERQIPELELVCPEYYQNDQLSIGNNIYPISLSGVNPNFSALRSWKMQPGGRFLNALDIQESRRVIVLGDGIKAMIFGKENPIGKQVIIKGVSFTVVGVMQPKEQDSSYGAKDQDRGCIPTTTFEQIFSSRSVSPFIFRAKEQRLHSHVINRIYEVLGRSCHFDPTDRAALYVWDTTEEERIRNFALSGLQLMLGLSGVFTLLVGGVGAGNLMFIRVKQRSREIGIEMALGAKPRWILSRFLVDAMFLVACGGATGFLSAWVTVKLAAKLPITEQVGIPNVPLGLALGMVFLIGFIGILAGFFPARRAAQIDPVRVLNDQ